MSEAHYQDPYSSSGAAARWNLKGARMVYAAGSPSLALLEYLCIRGTAVTARQWYMIVFDIADETLVGTLDPDGLPRGWNALPHGRATQDFGKLWLEEREFPFLRVPSARLDIAFYPGEFNLLINPDFPELAKKLKVVERRSFTYLLNNGG
jgi:RES domain-containing protein